MPDVKFFFFPLTSNGGIFFKLELLIIFSEVFFDINLQMKS